MAKENSAGLGVYNVYGPRQTDEGRVGAIRTAGVVKEAEISFRGDNYDKLHTLTVPAGAKFIEAVATVVEAFTLGGTTPTINVGTSGSAGTNYAIEISETDAETEGKVVYNSTGAGTWASVLAADTTVAVELDGTTPTIEGGEMTVVIRYVLPPQV